MHLWLAVLIGVLGTAIPHAANAQGARPAGMSDEELFGTVLRSSKWHLAVIPVCWENPASSDLRYRNLTQAAVKDTWEEYSAIRFTGWGKCTDGGKGIRIRISDETAHVKALGRFLDGYPAGMVLNFEFENWSRGCQRQTDFCVSALAAHEFGHALGFAHEQNRDDAPCECRRDYHQGVKGDYNVTKYDPSSIMNYCNPQWNGNGKLSALDIEAVRKFYGD